MQIAALKALVAKGKIYRIAYEKNEEDLKKAKETPVIEEVVAAKQDSLAEALFVQHSKRIPVYLKLDSKTAGSLLAYS